MKILFFISAAKYGKGGHSHSLNVLSREIAAYNEVQICGVGPGRTVVLEKNPYFNKTIYTNGIPDFRFLKDVKSVLNEFKPDIVHCFDEKVYLVITYAMTLLSKRLPVVLNKCGGPNIPDFAVSKYLVLFSKENLEYYQSKSQFSKTNFSLIPNRAVADLEKRDTNVFDSSEGKVRIFRIGRIGKEYRKTINLSINLARTLKQRGIDNFHLYLIGTIDDEDVKKDIEKEIAGLPVSIVYDHDITVKASAFLHYADIAICTGRGFMEACSFAIPVLAGSIHYNIPIPVNEGNFESFFHYNFSERADVTASSESSVIEEIEQLIESKGKRVESGAMSRRFFDEYFNIKGASQKYQQVYEKAILSRPTYFLSANCIRFLKALKYYKLSAAKFLRTNAAEKAAS